MMAGRIRRDERGFALATVMIVSLVLSLLAFATIDYAVGSQSISRHDQNWNAALAAAEAGIDDYIFHLNENGNYWLYNASNLPSDGNKAFVQYVPVPGSTTNAKFRYSVDASQIAQSGIVALTSTGRVGNAARSVRVTLRRASFLDYLYFTDFETTDPASYSGAANELLFQRSFGIKRNVIVLPRGYELIGSSAPGIVSTQSDGRIRISFFNDRDDELMVKLRGRLLP